MGCGRVGATAATTLEARGHSVAVIDQTSEAFRRLPHSFRGRKITGMGFDREVLEAAGVEEAFGFAAVSSGDNSNILAARVVRETFGVSNVVARIYDPDRAEVYERLGIRTVATVRWAADQVLRAILPAEGAGLYSDPSGKVTLQRIDPHAGWIGRSYADLEAASGGRVAFIRRFGLGELVGPTTICQEGDTVFLLSQTAQLGDAERTLARAPEAVES